MNNVFPRIKCEEQQLKVKHKVKLTDGLIASQSLSGMRKIIMSYSAVYTTNIFIKH